MKLDQKELKIDGSKLQVHIVLPYFNESIGLELLENTVKELEQNKVKEIKVSRVAGALEIPFACQQIIKKEKPDAIIALGVIIRGDTSHYDLVCDVTYQALMKLQLKSETPISFGILTCENEEQARDRSSANKLNKGKEVAQAALLQTTL